LLTRNDCRPIPGKKKRSMASTLKDSFGERITRGPERTTRGRERRKDSERKKEDKHQLE
jgi:hypothetical protein